MSSNIQNYSIFTHLETTNHIAITGQIDAADSLFYYAPPHSPDSYRDEAFVPVFELPTNRNVIPEDVVESCDGNEWCIFDYQATGDEALAMGSKMSFEEQDAIVQASMNGLS